MSDGLDILIIDDEKEVCDVLSSHIRKFYTWGDITTCTDVERAVSYCRSRPGSIMIFVLDVFVGDSNGFLFLDAIADKYPNACHDTIMITGNANDDVVDMCVASGQRAPGEDDGAAHLALLSCQGPHAPGEDRPGPPGGLFPPPRRLAQPADGNGETAYAVPPAPTNRAG